MFGSNTCFLYLLFLSGWKLRWALLHLFLLHTCSSGIAHWASSSHAVVPPISKKEKGPQVQEPAFSIFLKQSSQYAITIHLPPGSCKPAGFDPCLCMSCPWRRYPSQGHTPVCFCAQKTDEGLFRTTKWKVSERIHPSAGTLNLVCSRGLQLWKSQRAIN